MEMARMEAIINSTLEILQDREPKGAWGSRPDNSGLPQGFIHRAMGLWLVDSLNTPSWLKSVLDDCSKEPRVDGSLRKVHVMDFFSWIEAKLAIRREGAGPYDKMPRGMVRKVRKGDPEIRRVLARHLREEVLDDSIAGAAAGSPTASVAASYASVYEGLGEVLTYFCDVLEEAEVEQREADPRAAAVEASTALTREEDIWHDCREFSVEASGEGDDTDSCLGVPAAASAPPAPAAVATAAAPHWSWGGVAAEWGFQKNAGSGGEVERGEGVEEFRHEQAGAGKKARHQAEAVGCEDGFGDVWTVGRIPAAREAVEEPNLVVGSPVNGQEAAVQCDIGREADEKKLSLILSKLQDLQTFVMEGFGKQAEEQDKLKVSQRRLEEQLIKIHESLPNLSSSSSRRGGGGGGGGGGGDWGGDLRGGTSTKRGSSEPVERATRSAVGRGRREVAIAEEPARVRVAFRADHGSSAVNADARHVTVSAPRGNAPTSRAPSSMLLPATGGRKQPIGSSRNHKSNYVSGNVPDIAALLEQASVELGQESAPALPRAARNEEVGGGRSAWAIMTTTALLQRPPMDESWSGHTATAAPAQTATGAKSSAGDVGRGVIAVPAVPRAVLTLPPAVADRSVGWETEGEEGKKVRDEVLDSGVRQAPGEFDLLRAPVGLVVENDGALSNGVEESKGYAPGEAETAILTPAVAGASQRSVRAAWGARGQTSREGEQKAWVGERAPVAGVALGAMEMALIEHKEAEREISRASRGTIFDEVVMESSELPRSTDVHKDLEVMMRTPAQGGDWRGLCRAVIISRILLVYHQGVFQRQQWGGREGAPRLLRTVVVLVASAVRNKNSAVRRNALRAAADMFSGAMAKLLNTNELAMLVGAVTECYKSPTGFSTKEAEKAMSAAVANIETVQFLNAVLPTALHDHPKVASQAMVYAEQSLSRLAVNGGLVTGWSDRLDAKSLVQALTKGAVSRVVDTKEAIYRTIRRYQLSSREADFYGFISRHADKKTVRVIQDLVLSMDTQHKRQFARAKAEGVDAGIRAGTPACCREARRSFPVDGVAVGPGWRGGRRGGSTTGYGVRCACRRPGNGSLRASGKSRSAAPRRSGGAAKACGGGGGGGAARGRKGGTGKATQRKGAEGALGGEEAAAARMARKPVGSKRSCGNSCCAK